MKWARRREQRADRSSPKAQSLPYRKTPLRKSGVSCPEKPGPSCGTALPLNDMFKNGTLRLATNQLHTVKPLEVDIPKGRLTVVTGVSGSGKTTMVLESLVPALEAMINGVKLPKHIREIKAEGIKHIKLIDAAPIGVNVRSTVATYAGVHDELRKLYARDENCQGKRL